jgi:hypothetical protein
MRYLKYYESHLLNNLLEQERTPLQKLRDCKITSDGRFIIFEGIAYSTSNGEEVPINESWTLSDILHTGADVLSIGMDFIVPGSGAIVDILNGLSYILEAQLKPDQKQKDSLYLMGAISLAFVLLPGPLQAISIPLKRALKTGKGLNEPVVKSGLKIIGENISIIFSGMYKKINEALKSSLAAKILGKWKGKISGALAKFKARLTPILEPLVLFKGNADKAGSVVVSTAGVGDVAVAAKTGQKIGDDFVKSAAKESGPLLLGMGSRQVSKELLPQVTQKALSLSKMKNVKLGKYSSELMSKLSLKPGTVIKTRKGAQFIIGEIIDIDYVEITADIAGKISKKKVPIWRWICKNILQPSAKLNTTMLPFALKLLLRVFNDDGTINEKELKELDQITPEQLAEDMEILAPYQGTPEEGEFIYDVEGDTKYLYSYNDGRWYAMNKESGKIFNITRSEKFKESVDKLNRLFPEVIKGTPPVRSGSNQYNINNNVILAQKALILLGYDIGKGGPENDGVDGKLGPLTRAALIKFQNDTNIQNPEGKLNRATVKKLADSLSSKGIQNSKELVNNLRNI